MSAAAVPAVTVERGGSREVVIAQGALAPRAPRLFALVMLPTLLLTAALVALLPMVVAAGVAALLLAMDGLVLLLLVRVFASAVRIRVAPGRVEVTTGPAPRRTVPLDPARLRALQVARGGVHVKLGRTRLVRVAVDAVLDDGRRQRLFVASGRAAAEDLARQLVAAIAELGGPSVAVTDAA